MDEKKLGAIKKAFVAKIMKTITLQDMVNLIKNITPQEVKNFIKNELQQDVNNETTAKTDLEDNIVLKQNLMAEIDSI